MRAAVNAVPALFAGFLVLIGAAWVLGDPPGAGPDEPAHYIKALGAGGGDFYGRDPPPSGAELSTQERWHQRASREFTVPAGLGYDGFGCGYLGDHDWARCQAQGTGSAEPTERVTYVGSYQPFMYVVPGLVMRAASDPLNAMRLGRVANAALSLGLLALAALVLWEGSRGALSLVGLAVAVTPMVVFFATILNPSGPELTGAICFTACLLRLTRAGDHPGWVWAACAGSGGVLAMSRPLGPSFVVLLVAGVVVLSGWRRTRAAIRTAPRAAVAAAAAVVLACLAGSVWERTKQPHVSSSPRGILDHVDEVIDVLPRLAKHAVGVFAGLDIDLPASLYLLWWVMLGALLVAALYVGRGRERVALVGLAAAVVVVTVLIGAGFAQTGFGLQGRYVLPFAVLLPLWAGELLNRRRERLAAGPARALVIAVTAGAAVVHAGAWYTNGRQVSVAGKGGWLFPSDATWVPPLGWWTLTALTLAGATMYVLAGWTASRAPLRAPPS
jgi:hypothetical protein